MPGSTETRRAVCLSLRRIASPLGMLVAGAVEPGDSDNEPGGICLLEMGDADRRSREIAELEGLFDARFEESAASGLLDALEAQLASYFAGSLRAFDLPLVAPGTRFQHAVWDAMKAIPLGSTVTYGELARSIGREATASRAVGAASGRNRVSILIPCHRVVDLAYDVSQGGAAGLRGYGGGIENKQRLLEHERMVVGGAGLFERVLGGTVSERAE